MLKGVRVVILKDGKVLLGERLKRDSFYGLWCTFGGAVEEGETLEQALKRELNEELGIEALNPKFLTMLKTTATDDVSETLELYYFLVREWKGEVVNRSEHSEIRWFSFDELEPLPMGEPGRKVIKKYAADSF